MTLRQFRVIANKYGAIIERGDFADGRTIQVLTPSGKQWVSSGGQSLVYWHYNGFGEGIGKGYDELVSRMADGVEDFVDN